ncbi:MAG TPA: hypothetical protein VMW87_07620 [Spirochaetia bacterium]|nr:hypothetical protein [Spirochaetia bacterium]
MRAFSMIWLGALTLAVAGLLAGCETYVVRSGPADETALVGRVSFVLSGERQYGEWNGTHAADVYVTVRNLDTGREFVVRTQGRDGFFRIANPGIGRYVVVRYAYRFRTPSRTWVERTYVPANPRRFEIRRGVVTNLGSVRWYEDRSRMRDWDEW